MQAVDRDPFSKQMFRAPAERSHRFAAVALDHIPVDSAPRILDIGCGTGDELRHLVEALPGSTGVGVDISAANIAMAEEACGPPHPGGKETPFPRCRLSRFCRHAL